MISSPTFWIVLAASVAAYWALPARWRMGFLASASAAYLASLAPWSVAALAGWSLLFFGLAPRAASAPRAGRSLVPGLIVAALGYLAAFKYLPPLVAAVAPTLSPGAVALPLGISYSTFKLIHYAVEVGRGNIKDRSPSNFLAYVFLFPIFTAGPIERFDHFLANRDDRPTRAAFAEGLTRLMHGVVKKMLLADVLVRETLAQQATMADLLRDLPGLPFYKVWGFVVLWFLYTYLEFSAYSDVAIGASRLFGLRILENFDWPVLATNLGAFWKRWHMTLAGWCQAYVYMPLIGLTRSPYLATLAAFLAIGLWHGGSWGWVGWGLMHGLGVAAFVRWAQWKRKKKLKLPDNPATRLAGWAMTLAFVSAAGVLPAIDGAGGRPWDAVRVYAKLASLDLVPAGGTRADAPGRPTPLDPEAAP